MPIETAPGTELTYDLIAFDEPVTDVFLMSPGWRADVPIARGAS